MQLCNVLKGRLLNEFGIKELTAFQQTTFNAMYENEQDILMRAGTGKGKTFAYLLPILNQLYTENKIVSLVQPNSLLKTQSRRILDRFFINSDTQEEAGIKGKIKILTPRQLWEKREDEFDLCVVDEADLSLSPACLPPKMKLRSFLQEVIGGKKRIIYVGATYPMESSKRSLKSEIMSYNPDTRIIEDDTSVDDLSIAVENEHFVLLKEFGIQERIKKLQEILEKEIELGLDGNVMVFVKDKGTLNVVQKLNLDKRVILTTDLMARGYDINTLQAVIHLNPPQCAVDYVHRVGRLNRLNSIIPKEACRSYCLLGKEDLDGSGPTFLKLLLNSRIGNSASAIGINTTTHNNNNNEEDGITTHITNINDNNNYTNQNFRLSKLFSRNRSINKQIKRNKL